MSLQYRLTDAERRPKHQLKTHRPLNALGAIGKNAAFRETPRVSKPWRSGRVVRCIVVVMQSDDLKTRVMALAISVGVVWCVSLLGLFLLPHLPHELAIVPAPLRQHDGHPRHALGAWFAAAPHRQHRADDLLRRVAAQPRRVLLRCGDSGDCGARRHCVWLLGRDAQHIGASGVVFGFFGFLVVRGLYERRLSSIAVTALVILVYGGMVFGVLPRDDHVSWEAHLLGLLAGVAVARAGYALDKRNAVTEGAPR